MLVMAAQETHPLVEFRGRQQPPWSQADLARFLEVPRATVSRWESRERKIDPDLLPIVAQKTGIPARDLRPDLMNLAILLNGNAA